VPIVEFTIVNIGTLSMNKFWHETERKRSPSATCTLLTIAGFNLLVDPSPAPERLNEMLFAAAGLHPGDINAVFVTHFHGDHWFGLELFKGKPWFMAGTALEEWKNNAPGDQQTYAQFIPAEKSLPQGVDLFASPGHTAGLHSLMVNTSAGKMVVAGDAVMTRDFFDAGDGFHNSVDFSLAKTTIQRIKAAADLVVPGHGNFFLNPRNPGARL
jgi:glyoxylase-like metal-dependent hydrolase (beta-lactamase superfamily II)